MSFAKVIPPLIIFGLIAAIITAPWWGKFLRSYREITKVATSLSSSNIVCPFGTVPMTLLEFSKQEKIGAKISLLYCISERLNECFREWSTEALKRLFSRSLVALIVLAIGFAAVEQFGAQLQNADLFKGIAISTIVYLAVFALVSLTEFITAVELVGRYTELVKTGRKMIGRLS